MGKKIKIECGGQDYIDINDMTPFQGELKTLSEINYKRLRKEILGNGFSAPIFIWKSGKFNYILDGHQRQLTLLELIKEGYFCPKLPVVYIQARTKKQAKLKLLSYVSQYGKLEDQGLYEFIIESEIDPLELEDSYCFLGVDTDKFVDNYFSESGLEIKNTSLELDVTSFDNFKNKCPKCRFEWND